MNDDLERFLIAQQTYYRTALQEIKSGHKRSHWMWFIFPQIAGLKLRCRCKKKKRRGINIQRVYMENAFRSIETQYSNSKHYQLFSAVGICTILLVSKIDSHA